MSTTVLDSAEMRRRHGLPAAGELETRTYEWTPAHPPARTRAALLDDLRSRAVVAYAAVWGPIRELDASGRVAWRSLNPATFGRIDPAAVALCTNHDGPSLGQFLAIEPDQFGLRTTALYDDTPAGRRALADIRSGKVACYSVKFAAVESAPAGETRDGIPVLDVVEARLLDAGPATGRGGNPYDGPADPRARILWVGGTPAPALANRQHVADLPAPRPTVKLRKFAQFHEVDLVDLSPAELAATIVDLVGAERVNELTQDFDDARRRRARDGAETAERVNRALTALKTARQRAEYLYGCWRDGLATRAEVNAADAEAAQHDSWLREHLFADQYAALLRERGIPPQRSPLQRMLRDATAATRKGRGA